MRKTLLVIVAVALLGMAIPAFADLQNVVVGGEVRIRGNIFLLNNDLNSNQYAEQRTKLNVRADFTDAVSAFIELDSYGHWGETFRSNYLTGIDARGAADVAMYQAYIQAKEMWGTDLQVRIGRQEIKLGSGFLVGTNESGYGFTGLSFDAIRATYATDLFSVDAFAAKLAESHPVFEDGDADLYGVYGSYKGIENVTLDAYWLFARDARLAKLVPAIGNGSVDTHTFGLRGAGTIGAIDFDAEVAYQTQTWMHHNVIVDLQGETAGRSSGIAANVEVGYTFDMNMSPRVFVGGAFLDGRDDRLPFDRLFSDTRYSMFLDANRNLAGLWLTRLGGSFMPTESVKVKVVGVYGSPNDMKGLPNVGRPVWVDDEEIFGELDASVTYCYTQDLSFELGYAHLFQGAALILPKDDDMDYIYLETKLKF